MPFLEQVPRMDINSQSIQGIGLPDPYDIRRNLLDTVCNQTQCKDKDRWTFISFRFMYAFSASLHEGLNLNPLQQLGVVRQLVEHCRVEFAQYRRQSPISDLTLHMSLFIVCLILSNHAEIMDDISCEIPTQSSCLSYWERKQSWHTIGKIYTSLLHADELWENKHKNLRKRRAFSDLLSLLDNCGLSKRRIFVKV